MAYYTEKNATPQTVKIRNRLHDTGDIHLIALAHSLTDQQIETLTRAFGEAWKELNAA